MDRWFLRGALLAAPVAAVMGLAGCGSQPPQEAAAPAAEAAEQATGNVVVPAAPTPPPRARPLSPALFDLSTTVSQIENIFLDDLPLAGAVPHALAIRSGAEAYLGLVAEERREAVAPHVEAIRTLVDQLVTAADNNDQAATVGALEKLRDDHVRVLREMEQYPQQNP